MQKQYLINLNNIADLQMFVNAVTYNIACDVDAVCGRHCVDAKSILGVLSISARNILVKINTEDITQIEKFRQICERYEVKEF